MTRFLGAEIAGSSKSINIIQVKIKRVLQVTPLVQTTPLSPMSVKSSLTTQMSLERRPSPQISGPSSQTPDTLQPLLGHPEFKRLVALQAHLLCRKAVEEGRIRVLRQNPVPVFVPRYEQLSLLVAPYLPV
jgi:hypothetical protein